MRSVLTTLSHALGVLGFRYPIVVASILPAIIVFGLFVGPLRYPRGVVRDVLTRHSPAPSSGSQVLLVEIPPKTFAALTDAQNFAHDDAVRDLTRAVRRLRQLGSRQIAIGLLPDSADELIADAIRFDDIVFGRRVSAASGNVPYTPASEHLAQLPDDLKPLSAAMGILASPASELGVSRSHSPFVQVGSHVLPSLESLAAYRAGAAPMRPDQGRFLIDFRGDRHRLPTVSFQRATGGDLLATLVRDRVVLLGAGADPFAAGIRTPLSNGGEDLSELHYRGFAIDTLLRNSPLRESALAALLLTACAGLFGAWAVKAFSFRVACYAAFITTILYSGLAWLGLRLFALHVPVLELITVQPLSILSFVTIRQLRQERVLRRTTRRTAALISTLPLPALPADTSSAWSYLARFLRATLGLDRMLFFELEPRSEHLEEVLFEGSGRVAAREHRRDITCSPFLEAIQSNTVVEIDDPILEPSSPGLAQYLLPLSADGKTLGFCAVESNESDPALERVLLESLREVRPLLGRLLSDRHRMRGSKPSRTTSAGRDDAISLAPGRVEILEDGIESLHRGFLTLQQIIDEGSAASAVFDPAGDLLHVNDRMRRLAHEHGLQVLETGPSRLISKLSGFDTETARGIFRQVILENRSVVLPVSPLPTDTLRTLHIGPMKRQEDESGDSFRHGILVEVLDDEAAKHFQRHHAQISPIARRANRDIDRLTDVIEKLAGQGSATAGTLIELAKSTSHTIRVLEHRLANPPRPGQSDTRLIEACDPLRRAVERHADECRQRDISARIDDTERPVFVEASEAPFYDLLDASVSLLVRDAADASTLSLHISESAAEVDYDLRNQGYGMPANILRKALSEVDDGSLADLTRIRRALPAAQSVGGELTISSEVGEGIRIQLTMPKAL